MNDTANKQAGGWHIMIRIEGNVMDCGEGPFETKELAEDFAGAEVGAEVVGILYKRTEIAVGKTVRFTAEYLAGKPAMIRGQLECRTARVVKVDKYRGLATVEWNRGQRVQIRTVDLEVCG